ncbi:acyl-CoA carboxylase subunit epsilon [Amycolatopsis sp. NPDC059021]|uniref:acyl-CoA carboxylase subunit epsilon n=1 Tax=Amycolatopsis sp. NPDC059021 TaxID=3346704 RepID=UPI00366EEBDD
MTGDLARESTVDSPVLRVVRGVPDEVELAALVSVLAGLSTRSAACVARGARGAGEGRRVWAHPVWRPGTPPRAARDAWRVSLLPR